MTIEHYELHASTSKTTGTAATLVHQLILGDQPSAFLAEMARLWRERNWMRRDTLIKRALGFDNDYWHRAQRILRITDARRAELKGCSDA